MMSKCVKHVFFGDTVFACTRLDVHIATIATTTLIVNIC